MVLSVRSYGFSYFLHSLRFRVQGIYFQQFHEATMFGWPRKSRSTSGFGGTIGYSRLSLMDFSYSHNPYVLDVKESVFGSFAQPCSSDLKNLGQLPVLQELEGTDNLVLCILVISSLLTFSRSRNLFLAVTQSYHVRVTSKIQVNFRFPGYSRVLSVRFYLFQWFLQSLCFRCQGICF